jgi:hypothetical protein
LLSPIELQLRPSRLMLELYETVPLAIQSRI